MGLDPVLKEYIKIIYLCKSKLFMEYPFLIVYYCQIKKRSSSRMIKNNAMKGRLSNPGEKTPTATLTVALLFFKGVGFESCMLGEKSINKNINTWS